MKTGWRASESSHAPRREGHIAWAVIGPLISTLERCFSSEPQTALLMISGANQSAAPSAARALALNFSKKPGSTETDVVVEAEVERFRVVAAEPGKVAEYPKTAIGAGKLLYLAAWVGRGELPQVPLVAFVAAIVPELPLGDFRLPRT